MVELTRKVTKTGLLTLTAVILTTLEALLLALTFKSPVGIEKLTEGFLLIDEI